MGSRRLGWAGGRGGGCGGCPLPEPATPMPTPVASTALTIGELLNLLLELFSFFLFCYVENKKKRRRTESKREAKAKQAEEMERKWNMRVEGETGSKYSSKLMDGPGSGIDGF